MRARFSITPQHYATVALVALGALSLIVLTGAGVRLTGVRPRLPGLAQVLRADRAAARHSRGDRVRQPAAYRLRRLRRNCRQRARLVPAPFRWHLALFGALLPLGVIGQAILGALVVKHHLAPGLVMSHFILSMLLLDASFALAWCSRYEPWERRRSSDRLGVWAVRALIPLGQLTIAAGTVATASGPHAGAHAGQLVRRFDFEGTGTLEWVVQRHAVIATVFGLSTIVVWFLLRRPGGDNRAVTPLTAVIGLLALQGVVGGVQWALKLPTEIVWLHVALAIATWLAMLWTVAAAGRLAPRHHHSKADGTMRRRSDTPTPALTQS